MKRKLAVLTAGGLAAGIFWAMGVSCGQTPASSTRPSEAATKAAAGIVEWRNDTTGRCPDAQPVTAWDSKKNILWTADLGNRSYSCPIVVGDKVFVEAEPDTLFCLNRADGKVLWKKSNALKELPAEMQPKEEPSLNPEGPGGTGPTPCSDGKMVYAVFGTGVVAAYDLDGTRKWIKYIEQEIKTSYGMSASPILVDGKLIITLGWLTALEPATGKVLWEAKEAEANYGTPTAAKIGDDWVIITPNGAAVAAADGKVLATEIGRCGYTSPIVQDGVVYFIDSAYSAVKLPAKLGGKFVTKEQELWFDSMEQGEYYASPVYHDGLIYAISGSARYTVIDAKTGKKVLDQVLELPPAGQQGESAMVYPSLCLAGKNIFVTNSSGDTYVLAPGREYKEVSRNALGDGSGATNTFAGKEIFIRGSGSLYCIGQK